MVEKRKEERRRRIEREKVGKRRERFFFFDVFVFTISKFSLILFVYNRVIDGEKKYFYMCKLVFSFF